MRLISILSTAFFLLMVPVMAWSAPILAISESNITVEQPVTAGEVVKGVFDLCNQGDSDLFIANVAPGCGCAVPTYDRQIPPGGHGKIILEVNTTGFQGPVYKSAVVESNDPERHRIMITVQFQVAP